MELRQRRAASKVESNDYNETWRFRFESTSPSVFTIPIPDTPDVVDWTRVRPRGHDNVSRSTSKHAYRTVGIGNKIFDGNNG